LSRAAPICDADRFDGEQDGIRNRMKQTYIDNIHGESTPIFSAG